MALGKQPRVFITGGGSGLGRALCVALAARGSRILVADINVESARETVDLIKAAGGEGQAFHCDVAQVQHIEDAAKILDKQWGGVDFVVNNAGVGSAGSVGETSLKDWEWIMQINLWGVIYGCHVFAPRLKAQGSGHILNVASCAGIASAPEMAAYNVTKAAVISLSETLYGELHSYGAGVTVLCPTFFSSNLMSSFRSPKEHQRLMAEGFFARASMDANATAAAVLKAVDAGKLYCLPQKDARVIWRIKRMLPEYYFRKLAQKHRSLINRLKQKSLEKSAS